MPVFAQLANNTVIRMIVAPESPGGSQWRAAPSGTMIGQIWDGVAFVDAPRHPTHAAALAAADATVRAASDLALAAATERASPVEMATWPGKLRAAQAWEGGGQTADTQAQLDAVGIPRGLDRAGAAQLILTKAGRFQAAANAFEATRVAGIAALVAVDQAQPLAAYIDALDAVVDGLDWSI